MELTLNNEGLYQVEGFLDKLESTIIKIGVLNNPEQAQKAYQNEFGFITDDGYKTPARSNIQYPIENNEGYLFSQITIQNYNDDDIEKSTNGIGDAGLEVIDRAFDTQGYGSWADNAPMTIAIKGKNTPLIDTGKLRKSYSYEVSNEKAS